MPFYNTNGSGTEKSDPVGYRSDSSAGNTDGSGLVLALPGDVMTDEHDHVNTNSSAKTRHADTKVYVSAADSRYYGKSLYFNGNEPVVSKYFVLQGHSGFNFIYVNLIVLRTKF